MKVRNSQEAFDIFPYITLNSLDMICGEYQYYNNDGKEILYWFVTAYHSLILPITEPVTVDRKQRQILAKWIELDRLFPR